MNITAHRPGNLARTSRLAGAAALLIALTALLPVPAAHADAGSVTCTGTSELTYDPGLTLTPQDATVNEHDTVPSCTSTDSTVTAIITHPISYPVTSASCDQLQVTPFSGTGLVLHWNNGQTSTLTGLVSVFTVTGGIMQLTATGTATAGEFSGGVAVITWAYVVDPLQCLAPGGLTTLDGTILVQITSP